MKLDLRRMEATGISLLIILLKHDIGDMMIDLLSPVQTQNKILKIT